MKRFFLVWIMILAGLTNYSKVSENYIEPLITCDQENTFDDPDSYDHNRQGITVAPSIRLSEELFIFSADGTIFVSQMEDLLLKDLVFINPDFR